MGTVRRLVEGRRSSVGVGLVALVFGAVVVLESWAGRPLTAGLIVSALISGIATGSIYAIAASGLVVTYTTSGVFNFAQGAMGMFCAFIYWELRVHHHLPAPLAIALVVLVIAPLFGAVIERLLMRHVQGAPLIVQLVVSLGLMLALMGLAVTIWDPNTLRTSDHFFGSTGFHVGNTVVLWHRFITICVAAVVALGLRFLLFRTRIGTAMRAVVDNRSLAGLNGARPERISMFAWALGTSLAAVAGILLAPELDVRVEPLTLIIIDAFAAAILGRLRNLPWTFVGGILLGLLGSLAVTFLNLSGRWSNVNFAVPTIFLFFVLLALPQARLELGKVTARRARRVPGIGATAAGMAVLWVVVVVASMHMAPDNLNRWTLGAITAVIMLSLVPLTGWGGQVSLAQITFAGAGAFAMWKVAGASGNPIGLVAAAAIAVPFGIAMALPALRLQGLYLALASLAFARMAETLLFDQPEVFGTGTGARLVRLSMFGYRFDDQRSYLLLVTALFGVLAVSVVGLRRGRWGRRLIALRDSPAASATLGINVMATKLAVFAVSAAIAGFGGALLAMHRGTASTDQYTMLTGLPIVLIVVVGGVGGVGGAVFGGIFSQFIVVVQATWSWAILRSIERLGPGLASLGVAKEPEGAASQIADGFAPLLALGPRALRTLRGDRRATRGPDLGRPSLDGRGLEGVGLDRPFNPEVVADLDRRLGVTGLLAVPRPATSAASGARPSAPPPPHASPPPPPPPPPLTDGAAPLGAPEEVVVGTPAG